MEHPAWGHGTQAAFRPVPEVAVETHPNKAAKLSTLRWMAGFILLLGLAPLHSAVAQNPFDIFPEDPTLFAIDAGADEFSEPFSSIQELGPINGNTTKLGVIHTATPTMLGFTNPNGQTDIVRIWLAKAEAVDGDTWLYFAWERDASSGSSVIAYEFQQEGLPIGCDYDPEEIPPIDIMLPETAGETALVNYCNPWSGRQDGDFMIVWDFKGGATEIVLRKFDGLSFGSILLNVNESPAALNGDTSMGEGAINLTETVFPSDPTECLSIGNIIPGTITGNSDSADYKDTVLADFTTNISISNCGEVLIRKETDPSDAGGSFTFDHNLDLLPNDTSHTPFSLSHDGEMEFTEVVVPGTGYWVKEGDPGADFELTDIRCSANVASSDIYKANGLVTFNLDRAERVECTFTNTQRGNIIVVKQTDPDGSEASFDFTTNYGGGSFSLTDGTQNDSGPLSPTSEAGTYSVAETDLPTGWTTSGSSCDDGSPIGAIDLDPGETVTCTFNNTITRGKIIVVKQTDPDGSEASFGFTTNYGGGSFSLTDGAQNDSGDLLPSSEAGTYSVAETDLPTGWTTSGSSCDDGSPIGAIDLDPGETVTCTFNNTITRGNIIVVKQTDPDGSEASFGFTTNYGGGSFSLTDGAQNDSGDLLPSSEAGTYSVAETDLPTGWTTSGSSCDDGSPIDAIDLDPGETVICTFNNTIAQASIIVVKQTDPDGSEASFGFTTNYGGGSFSLTDGAQNDSGDLLPSSEAGTYSVAETDLPTGWTTSGSSCDDGSPIGAIDLDPGETVTCTFNNTITRGKIIVVKQTDPDGSEASFGFTTNYGGGSFSLTDGAQNDSGDLLPSSEAGTYSVAETDLPTGWTTSGSSCDDGSPIGAIDLDPGETVTCTFNNTITRGNIIVAKQTSPSGSLQSFAFTSSYDGDGFSLTDGTQNDSGDLLPSSEAGTYSVAETVPGDWRQTNATCSDDSPINAIDVAPGETVTCTFVNAPRTGAIKITKTRKYAGATSGDPNIQPHENVDFVISGGSLAAPVPLITNGRGEACLPGLVLSTVLLDAQSVGPYAVTEIVPLGYVADGDSSGTPGNPGDPDAVYSENVFVNQEGNCDPNGASAESVTFGNTPLTNVTVTAASIDPGATKSQIECYQGSQDLGTDVISVGELIPGKETSFDDPQSLNINNQLPLWENGLIVCTIKIDP